MPHESPTKVSEFDLSVDQKDAFVFEVDFGKEHYPILSTDEPPPLGKDLGPAPSRMLAAAIGNCLAASLVFCAKRQAKVDLHGLQAQVHVEIVRNESKRLRIGKIDVTLRPRAEDAALIEPCRDIFEDFCTVTESVRAGIAINVQVEAQGA